MSRLFKVLLVLTCIIGITFIIELVQDFFSNGYITLFDDFSLRINSGSITLVLLLLFVVFPKLWDRSKYYYQIIKIRYLAFLGKRKSYEEWKEIKHKLSFIYQDIYIDYYQELRNYVQDEKTLDRMLKFEYKKGDRIEHFVSTLGSPDFTIYRRFWQYREFITYYYFPYYEKKSLLNFFNL